MPSHSSIAARVRRHKEEHPEMYCAYPKCLWRTGGANGTPCQKHPTVGPFKPPTTIDDYRAELREESLAASDSDIPTLTPITDPITPLDPEKWK